MENLDEKVVLVTGGASGIGRAMAEAFGARDARLVMADIEEDALRSTAEDMRANGSTVLEVLTDVSDAGSMDRLAATALDEFGRVDVICLNAGVGGGGTMWDLSTGDWEWVIGVNLWGVIHGIRVFVPHLVAQGSGHVVITASIAGLVSAPGLGPYNATKHAAVSIAETLSGELVQANLDIGVSVLCPSFVKTRIWDSERNRPAHLSGGGEGLTVEERAALADAAEAYFAEALDPAVVAEQVVEAVEQRRFAILPNPELNDLVRADVERLLSGEGPSGENPFF
ncbi:MAG: 3-phenylpropionate-dihydrodiol/cinnamic acid-dihydrodiol dehydrogenase [Acidimicrobiales bacterium]|nr:MAG: SDR family NAD(P)-dependent oxidoreductase [Actinomycetota bacterium]MBV6510299.1 3-phenylpropionate-dihydrodiol/cinnamic acid-dihydrodiol dehydrogenase [Acidimicrobiales bacterium]RIK03383.1 MAG: 3-oxoacyl-ACP reductase [Acidobacteriota bacterium]